MLQHIECSARGRITRTYRKPVKFPRPQLSRVPVWVWRALMAQVRPGERRRFNRDPIDSVDYHLDIDYVGDGIRQHRLDVIVPHDATAPLPVYVYFHGGGWTSGDKAPLTLLREPGGRAAWSSST